eukprot:3619620-Pleurochrysis_carterae.AAC.1
MELAAVEAMVPRASFVRKSASKRAKALHDAAFLLELNQTAGPNGFNNIEHAFLADVFGKRAVKVERGKGESRVGRRTGSTDQPTAAADDAHAEHQLTRRQELELSAARRLREIYSMAARSNA